MDIKVDRKAAIKKLKTLVITPKSEIEQFRSKIEESFDCVFLPNHVECMENDYGGVKCDMLIPEVYSSSRIILYIHGGSFTGGSRDSWRNFCSSIAHFSSSRVVVPEFRLPPTYVYPAALEDLQTVFRMIYSESQVEMQIEGSNTKPQLVIAADGTGASLAVALILKLREKYRQSIENLILLSPCLDFSSDNPIICGKNISDEVLTGASLHRAVDLYTFASNIDNPLVSPLKAPMNNFLGFPKVYIQMGEKEILLKQVEEFIKKLKSADVEYVLDVWPKMMFMFQMADEFLPESHLAIEKLGNYISSCDGNGIEQRVELMKKKNLDKADKQINKDEKNKIELRDL